MRGSLAGVLVVLLACGCEQWPAPPMQTRAQPKPGKKEDPRGVPPQRAKRVFGPFPSIDPKTIEPMEVRYFSEPTGEGYRRAPVKFGPSLHSGKWLGFDHGNSEFFSEKHVVVNHFRNRPDSLFRGEITKNVLLDTETGEVVAEFRDGGLGQQLFGLGIVWIEGDKRPYLLHAETGDMVLAVPEGKHEYVYGKNYWLVWSPLAKRIWVTAKDHKGKVHLYAWENLREPPELPNNPFYDIPQRWNPLQRHYDGTGDFEEVDVARYMPWDHVGPWDHVNRCTRAVLYPPKGFECLDDSGLEESEPLSGGWRFIDQNDRPIVFNRYTNEGYEFSSLCPADQPVGAQILKRDPPTLRLGCAGNADVWMKWTAPNHVQKMRPEYARLISKHAVLDLYDQDRDVYVLLGEKPNNVKAMMDWDRMIWEVIGTDFECINPSFRVEHRSSVMVNACSRERGRVVWWVLTDRDKKLRTGRFQATDMAVGRNGVAVAIVRRGNKDHVVRATVGK
jgi:hypothetical protein